MLPKLTLVIGGAASGKSMWAERLVAQASDARVYLATFQPGLAGQDAEMTEKLRLHRERRGTGWRTEEAGADLLPALTGTRKGECVLLDCATMWLGSLAAAAGDMGLAGPKMLAALAQCPAPVVVVTNEMGLSMVPETAEARAFRQAHGAMNQALAAHADLVVTVMAGLPLVLRGTLPADAT